MPVVELRALELPDVRTYVQHHPTGGDSLTDVETIEILHRRSAGLPVHLDRLLDSLRYVGREELGEFELDTQSDAHEEVPHSLERAVTELANSPARYSKRSYRLLKILTLLPDGERLEQLKHFDGTEPLFPRNAAELEALSLLQVGVVARIVPGPHDAHRQDPHWPMRYDTGRPSSVIRLRISQPRTTSLPCPAGLRARRPSPMMDL